MDNDSNSEGGRDGDDLQWLQQQISAQMGAGNQADEDDEEWEDPSGGVLRDVLELAGQEEDVEQLTSLLTELEELSLPVDTPGPDGDSPLHIACLFGNLPGAKLLLARGADPCVVNDKDGSTPLHDACASGHLDIVAVLLEHMRAPGQVESALGTMDEDGDTVLHHAARGGHVAIVQLLVSRGANPYAVNTAGRCPMEEAEDERDVVEYLSTLSPPHSPRPPTHPTSLTPPQPADPQDPGLAPLPHEGTAAGPNGLAQ